MRREFILFLLGIIVVSSISSILSPLVDSINENYEKVLLDTVSGFVGAGNFSYWQLGHSGPLVVELTSLTGDADLYIADNNKPSFELDKNNFSSATCGLDTVLVPADFPRPIGLGVFGHWSHSVSQYSIQVFAEGGALPQARPPHEERPVGGGGAGGGGEERPPRLPALLDFLLDKLLDRFALV